MPIADCVCRLLRRGSLRRVSLAGLWAVGALVGLEGAAHAGDIQTVIGTGQKTLGVFRGPAAEFNIGQPFGVEVGPDGAIYATEVENHRVVKLDPKSGEVTTIAGNGKKGYSGDGGPATAAELNEPYEVRIHDGDVYFVEMVGAVIRKIDGKTGVISTVAGTGQPGFGGDGGPATAAQFKQPHSIAFDGAGGLFVADIGNHRIRRIDLKSGLIETICGDGRSVAPQDGEAAKTQPIRSPRALYVSDRTLWVALREGHSLWKLNLEDGRIHHAAGTGKVGAADGPGKSASFNGPKGVDVGPDGAVYIVDTENQTIRRFDPKTGVVSTVAGGGPQSRGYGGDGGPALKARMDRPHGIAIDDEGNLYIGDTNNHRVRKVLAGDFQ
ncbi:MAG TPA: hypothetical protein VGE52_04835 [Pirellulales bacterium]